MLKVVRDHSNSRTFVTLFEWGILTVVVLSAVAPKKYVELFIDLSFTRGMLA